MATNLKLVAILLIVSMVTIKSTCKKGTDCFNQIYSFVIVSKAYPDLDSINMGDTIWIELNEASIFKDLQTGNDIDYSNAENIGFGLTFDRLIGGDFNNPGTMAAVKDFTTVLKDGKEIEGLQPNRIKSYNFLEQSGRYKFKIAIIPNQAGIYSIAISNAANVYRKNDKCTKASFKITFANTNQHLYLYQSNRPGYKISEYERMHMYCFKVK